MAEYSVQAFQAFEPDRSQGQKRRTASLSISNPVVLMSLNIICLKDYNKLVTWCWCGWYSCVSTGWAREVGRMRIWQQRHQPEWSGHIYRARQSTAIAVYLCNVYLCKVYLCNVYLCNVYLCNVYLCNVYLCIEEWWWVGRNICMSLTMHWSIFFPRCNHCNVQLPECEVYNVEDDIVELLQLVCSGHLISCNGHNNALQCSIIRVPCTVDNVKQQL